MKTYTFVCPNGMCGKHIHTEDYFPSELTCEGCGKGWEPLNPDRVTTLVQCWCGSCGRKRKVELYTDAVDRTVVVSTLCEHCCKDMDQYTNKETLKKHAAFRIGLWSKVLEGLVDSG